MGNVLYSLCIVSTRLITFPEMPLFFLTYMMEKQKSINCNTLLITLIGTHAQGLLNLQTDNYLKLHINSRSYQFNDQNLLRNTIGG